MKRLSLAAGFIVVLGAGAYAYVTHDHDQDQPQILDAAVSRGDITETVQATGTLEALRTVQIGSQVSGVVQELDADYNTIVKKGQIIARLDPALYQVQVNVQQATIEKEQTDISSQELQLQNAQLTADRTQALFDKQLIDKQSLDTAILNVKTLQAAILSAKKQLVQAQANLQQAQLNLSYCTIRSPIDGVVVQRQVDVGQTVQSSMTTPQFFVLASDLTNLRLTASVDESDIGRIRPDQDVVFTVDAYPGEKFHGKVDSVRLNSVTTSNVVTYQTVVNVANPALKLRPSMTATLDIIINTAPNVLRVPNTALRFHPTADIAKALGVSLPASSLGPQRPAARPMASFAPTPPTMNSGAAAAASPSAAGEKIDDFFAPVRPPNAPATVWTWNEATKQLAKVDLRVGVTDGKYSQVLSGNVQPGEDVLESVVLPVSEQPVTARSPLMSPQRGGNFRGRGF